MVYVRYGEGEQAEPSAVRNCETYMQDVIMIAFTVVFFALAFLYVKACQKLR
jgi:hypothetical protein